MASHVHVFDAREGGLFRVSLTNDEPTGIGKTTAHTDLLGVHDNLPPGLSPADNETGWQIALDKLVALVEAGHNQASQ